MSNGMAEEFDLTNEVDKVTHIEATGDYRLVIRNGEPLLQRMFYLSCIKDGERVMKYEWTDQETIYE